MGLHAGTMSETAYDTAWAARVRSPAAPDRLAFPSALAWLRTHQHADGSWGGQVPLVHDRVVSTLAAVIALVEAPEPRDAAAVRRGIAYLETALGRLDGGIVDTVGFELIFPALLARARQIGLALPYEQAAAIDRMRMDKLRRLPAGFVYTGPTSLAYSLEFLGDDLQLDLVGRCQAANGSFGASPAATAYVLMQQWSEKAAGYLRAVLSLSERGGACDVFPFEIFEKGWTLYHLEGLMERLSTYYPHLTELAAAWTPAGVGYTSQGMVPDGDETAVILKVLHTHGFAVSPRVLKLFEAEEYFFCFPLERNQSVSTNAHILDALKACGAFPERAGMLKKAVDYLAASQIDGRYWRDKWHMSPYYATAHAMVALVGAGDAAERLGRSAVSWLLETQRPNGGWSEMEPAGTAEETAYALWALGALSPCDPAARAAMQRAAAFLWEGFDTTRYPELWIGKGLYAPHAVVRAAVLGALFAYEQDRLARGAVDGS